MGRTRHFNPSDVIDSALIVFARKGYAGSSLEQLLSGMKIGRGSFYCLFRGKEDLYHACLQRYATKQLQCLADDLRCSDSTPDGFINGLANFLLTRSNPSSSGCFVTCAVSEFGTSRPRITEIARWYFGRIEEIVERYFRKLSRVNVPDNTPQRSERSAATVVTLLIGLDVRSRAGIGDEELQRLIRGALGEADGRPLNGSRTLVRQPSIGPFRLGPGEPE